jgi:hypothetical protein
MPGAPIPHYYMAGLLSAIACRHEAVIGGLLIERHFWSQPCRFRPDRRPFRLDPAVFSLADAAVMYLLHFELEMGHFPGLLWL